MKLFFIRNAKAENADAAPPVLQKRRRGTGRKTFAAQDGFYTS